MCREAAAPEKAVCAKWLDNNRSRRTWERDQHLTGVDAATRGIPHWFICSRKPERCHTAVWLNSHSWNWKPPFETTDVITVAPVRVHLKNRKPLGIFIRGPNTVDAHVRNSDVPAQ